MKAILIDTEKLTATIKITVTNTDDKEKVIKNSILFGRKHLRANSFMEISLDMLCVVCCN